MKSKRPEKDCICSENLFDFITPEYIHENISHDFGEIIEHYQVTKSVNNPKNNNALLIEEFNEVPF